MLIAESEFREPPPNIMEVGQMRLTLQHHNRWSAVYKRGNETFVFSKLLYGTFDWSYFENNCPDDLSDDEMYPVATSIYTAGERDEIPQEWRDFAKRLCGPGWDKNIPERMRHLFGPPIL